LDCPGTAAVDEGLDKRVDGPLEGGSNEDLFEVVLAFERFGRVGPVTGTGASPDLLENDASQQSANHRTGEADRTVEDLLEGALVNLVAREEHVFWSRPVRQVPPGYIRR